MPLGSYAEVSPWSEAIREAVAGRRMPPWHADPRHGHWRNDRSLSPTDRAALLTWIDAGCPEGKPLADAPQRETDGWRVKPDCVITMPEQSIPASGAIPYRYIPVPTGFKENVWVRAAEVRPGNRRAVHHALIFAGIISVSGEGGMIASYLPGDEPLELPEGYAKRIPAGAPLVFQLHYTATGRPETDRTSIGLVFAGGPPTHEVRSVDVENRAFRIPAGASNHELRSTYGFTGAVELLTLTPHMHLRGKDFTYTVTRPGVAAETLLSVPRYDFNWQTTYRLDKPLALPAGSVVDCAAHYDNSAGNPANPDPKQTVTRGEQTTDEMMIGFIDYAFPRGTPPPFAAPPLSPPPAEPLWLSPVPWLSTGGGLLVGAAVVRAVRRRRNRGQERHD
jgi:hypothetical protein